MRTLFNLIVSSVLIVIFEGLGWIVVAQKLALTSQPYFNMIANAAVVSIVMGFAIALAGAFFGIVFLVAVGLQKPTVGCVSMLVYFLAMGPVGFAAVNVVLPGWVTINAQLWQVILMGIAVGIFGWTSFNISRKVEVKKADPLPYVPSTPQIAVAHLPTTRAVSPALAMEMRSRQNHDRKVVSCPKCGGTNGEHRFTCAYCGTSLTESS